MEKSSLYHSAGSSFVYAYDEKTIHIKMQTKANDVNEVYLIYGDPYDYRQIKMSDNLSEGKWEWHNERKQMKKVGSDGIHDFWFADIEPTWKRMRYAFYLESDSNNYIFGERITAQVTGLSDKELHNVKNFFCFPFINGIDVYKAPEWVKDAVWYQIFPERFANGDVSNDPVGAKEWNAPITSSSDHYGGDLQGVIDHLDYIKELGVNAIYFTPIFQSNSNHKYDTIDYMTVDPHFGDEAILKTLVEGAHARGIKVMLDIVFNHCGLHFDKFQDVIEKGEDSPYKDWFHIKGYPVFEGNKNMNDPRDLNFDTFAFTPRMPKLNTENPETKEYLLNIIRYWSDVASIDGWRLDVANEVDHKFWREFRTVVKEKNPNAYILGEVWHDANPWLMGDQFDGVMNYPLNDAIIDYFANDSIDTLVFSHKVIKANFNYPRHVNEHMYNLLDSHDTPRFLHITGENIDKLKLAYVFLMTQMGAPAIYYGDEVGMTGKHDPDCRRPMIWDVEKQDLDMLAFMKQLIQIRKSHEILRHKGELSFLQETVHPDVLLYKRYDEVESCYMIMNRSSNEVSYQLPEEMIGNTFYDIWNKEELKLSESIIMKPYGFYILKFES